MTVKAAYRYVLTTPIGTISRRDSQEGYGEDPRPSSAALRALNDN